MSVVSSLISGERIKWIESLRAKYDIPGLAITVVAGPKANKASDTGGEASGWITQLETFGTRNCNGDKFENDTIFAIGSNSKLFASLSASMLIAKGTRLPNGEPLTWTTKVKHALGDDWVVPDEWATNHAELNDLAGMRLGMAASHFAKMPMNPPLSPSQQLHRLRNLSMAAELRQQFSYDSNCYLALSHLVPTLTDILYHDFLQKEIFKPLGMKDAHCDSNEVRASGRAVDGFLRKGRGNDQDSDDLAVIGKPMPVGWWTYDHGYWMLAAGGIAMTINDASKFVRELLSPQYLPAQVINERADPLTILPAVPPFRLEPPVTVDCYGRGQMISTYRQHAIIWHTGNMPGQASLLACIPSKEVGLFIAINDGSIGAALAQTLRAQLLDDLLGLKPTEDYDKKYLGAAVKALATATRPTATTTSVPSPNGELSLSKIDNGIYYHPGYLTMKLAPFDRTTAQGKAMIDIANQKGMFSALDESCLLASMNKFWLSHLVFRPLPLSSKEDQKDDAKSTTRLYEWYGYQVYDIVDKFSRPTTGEFVATLRGKGPAVSTPWGMGMFGGFSNAIGLSDGMLDPELVRNPLRVEREAEVWFARVAGEL